jgi:hypothetical protein
LAWWIIDRSCRMSWRRLPSHTPSPPHAISDPAADAAARCDSSWGTGLLGVKVIVWD